MDTIISQLFDWVGSAFLMLKKLLVLLDVSKEQSLSEDLPGLIF